MYRSRRLTIFGNICQKFGIVCHSLPRTAARQPGSLQDRITLLYDLDARADVADLTAQAITQRGIFVKAMEQRGREARPLEPFRARLGLRRRYDPDCTCVSLASGASKGYDPEMERAPLLVHLLIFRRNAPRDKSLLVAKTTLLPYLLLFRRNALRENSSFRSQSEFFNKDHATSLSD